MRGISRVDIKSSGASCALFQILRRFMPWKCVLNYRRKIIIVMHQAWCLLNVNICDIAYKITSASRWFQAVRQQWLSRYFLDDEDADMRAAESVHSSDQCQHDWSHLRYFAAESSVTMGYWNRRPSPSSFRARSFIRHFATERLGAAGAAISLLSRLQDVIEAMLLTYASSFHKRHLNTSAYIA